MKKDNKDKELEVKLKSDSVLENNIDSKDQDENEGEDNRLALGICFGLFGGTILMSILSMLGANEWRVLAIGFGLLIGIIVSTSHVKTEK